MSRRKKGPAEADASQKSLFNFFSRKATPPKKTGDGKAGEGGDGKRGDFLCLHIHFGWCELLPPVDAGGWGGSCPPFCWLKGDLRVV